APTGAGLPSTAGPTTSTNQAGPSSSSPFATPDRIGRLTKSSDQSQATALIQALPRAMQNPFAAYYDDPQSASRHVLVAGGTIKVLNPGAQMDGFFNGAVAFVPGSKGSNRRAAGTGSAGGLAQCETITGGSTKFEICGWLGQSALVEMIFVGFSPATTDPLV